MGVQVRVDSERGCGWREPGKLYLISGAPMRECFRLPIPLTCCPTCSAGIKFARSWTWVNGDALAAAAPCKGRCDGCAMSQPLGRCGLLWVGEQFYKMPSDWTMEALRQGVSRKIKAVPRDFVLGETLVLMAHSKAIRNADGSFTPGIFSMFRPQAIEYITKGDETEEFLTDLEKRKITPVKVYHDEGMLPNLKPSGPEASA